MTLGGHADAQRAVGVGYHGLGVVIHRAVRAGGTGACVVGAVAEGGQTGVDGVEHGPTRRAGFGQDGVIHGHAGLHLGDVALGDFDFDLHVRQIGDLDDGGRGLVGVDGLAFLHGHGHHGAVQRSGNFGVAQIGFSRVDRDLSLANLGFKFGHGGLGRGQGVFGVFQAFARSGIGFSELGFAVVLGLGHLEGHLLGRQLSLVGIELGLVDVQVVALGGGVDVRDGIALADLLPHAHVKFFDLARSLGAHADQLDRAHFAGGVDHLADIGHARGFGNIVDFVLLAGQGEPGSGRRDDDDDEKDGQSFGATFFHRGCSCLKSARGRADARRFRTVSVYNFVRTLNKLRTVSKYCRR